jgi:hypothetical protein
MAKLKRRKILLKILLTKEEQDRERNLTIPEIRPDSFKRTPISEIIREVEIQHDIYTKSLAENDYALEPICPGLLFVSPSCPKNHCINNLFPIISSKMQPREGKSIGEEIAILRAYFTANSGMHGIIAMDFADGFSTVESMTGNPLKKQALVYSLYEVVRMYRIGWMHRDFHSGNTMYCDDYQYLGFEPEDSGRSLIIDFGLSKQLGTRDTDDWTVPTTFEESIELLKKEYYGGTGKIYEAMLGFEKIPGRDSYDRTKPPNPVVFDKIKQTLLLIHESRLQMAKEFVEIFVEARNGAQTPEQFYKTLNMFTLDSIARGGTKTDWFALPKRKKSEGIPTTIKERAKNFISKCDEKKLKELFISAFQPPPVVAFVSNNSSDLGFDTRVDEKETERLTNRINNVKGTRSASREEKNVSKRIRPEKLKGSRSRSRSASKEEKNGSKRIQPSRTRANSRARSDSRSRAAVY